MPAQPASGYEITTLEDHEDEQRLMARCFVAAASVQCGFCIPGIALLPILLLSVRARSLLMAVLIRV